jgi:hypothetical protein
MLKKEEVTQIFDIMEKSDFEIESIGVDTSNIAPPHTWYLRIRKKEAQKESIRAESDTPQ